MPLLKVKDRWDQYRARLVNLALDCGVLNGHRNYTKYIILTRSRSGSNYLVDLLNSHSNSRCYSELFSRSGATHWGIHGYEGKEFNTDAIGRLKQEDPVRFLTQYVYKPAPRWITAVGFKIFYNHAHKGNGRDLWAYLEEMEDLKVIHLKRRNILKSVVSQKVAMASGQWVKRGGHGTVVPQTIEVSREECLRQFEKTKKWQQEYDDIFASKEKMDVIFEELVVDKDGVMNDVQLFLGMPRQHLMAGTKKQSSKPLVEVVSNYKELRDSFSGTEWEGMFGSAG